MSSPVVIDAIKCVRAEGLKTALLTNNWFIDEQKAKTVLPVDKSLFDVVGHRRAGIDRCLVW